MLALVTSPHRIRQQPSYERQAYGGQGLLLRAIRESDALSLNEWIVHGEIRKPPKMTISGPQLACTMQVTEGGNVRIVCL